MSSGIDEIYEDMKKAIINLDLLPGTKVSEEFLTERYHISRTPIRSVIARLEKDNLLIVRPKQGTYISRINMDTISDSLTIRKIIESHVLNTLCGKLDSSQLEELQSIIDEQEKIIKMEPSIEKSKAFFHNDNRFHATLFKFASMEGIWKIIHTNAINLNRARIMANLRETTQVNIIYNHHELMLKALRENRKDRLIELFIEHIDGGFEGINDVITKYKDYFVE